MALRGAPGQIEDRTQERYICSMNALWASLKNVLYEGFVRLEAWRVLGHHFDHIIVRATDSVACILVDTDQQRVLLVRQARPAMIRPDNSSGELSELVAGRFDVDKGPTALIIQEAWEEAEVRLTEDDVIILNGGRPMALSAGVLTERSYLAVAYISSARVLGEDDAVRGVAEEGERIRREWKSLKEFTSDEAVHDDIRVWAAAQYLRSTLSESSALNKIDMNAE